MARYKGSAAQEQNIMHVQNTCKIGPTFLAFSLLQKRACTQPYLVVRLSITHSESCGWGHLGNEMVWNSQLLFDEISFVSVRYCRWWFFKVFFIRSIHPTGYMLPMVMCTSFDWDRNRTLISGWESIFSFEEDKQYVAICMPLLKTNGYLDFYRLRIVLSVSLGINMWSIMCGRSNCKLYNS